MQPVIRVMTAPAGPVMTMILDVEVRGGGNVLWTGQMRASARTGATFNRQQTNANPRACPAADGYYGTTDNSSLNIAVSPLRRGADSNGLEIRASWERPGDGRSCQAGRSTRTVSIAETVAIAPGQEQVVSGDGGLTIRLRRRAGD